MKHFIKWILFVILGFQPLASQETNSSNQFTEDNLIDIFIESSIKDALCVSSFTIDYKALDRGELSAHQHQNIKNVMVDKIVLDLFTLHHLRFSHKHNAERKERLQFACLIIVALLTSDSHPEIANDNAQHPNALVSSEMPVANPNVVKMKYKDLIEAEVNLLDKEELKSKREKFERHFQAIQPGKISEQLLKWKKAREQRQNSKSPPKSN